MNKREARRKTTPHEITLDRIVFVEVGAHASARVATYSEVSASRIQRHGKTSSDIEVEHFVFEVLGVHGKEQGPRPASRSQQQSFLTLNPLPLLKGKGLNESFARADDDQETRPDLLFVSWHL